MLADVVLVECERTENSRGRVPAQCPLPSIPAHGLPPACHSDLSWTQSPADLGTGRPGGALPRAAHCVHTAFPSSLNPTVVGGGGAKGPGVSSNVIGHPLTSQITPADYSHIFRVGGHGQTALFPAPRVQCHRGWLSCVREPSVG